MPPLVLPFPFPRIQANRYKNNRSRSPDKERANES